MWVPLLDAKLSGLRYVTYGSGEYSWVMLSSLQLDRVFAVVLARVRAD